MIIMIAVQLILLCSFISLRSPGRKALHDSQRGRVIMKDGFDCDDSKNGCTTSEKVAYHFEIRTKLHCEWRNFGQLYHGKFTMLDYPINGKETTYAIVGEDGLYISLRLTQKERKCSLDTWRENDLSVGSVPPTDISVNMQMLTKFVGIDLHLVTQFDEIYSNMIYNDCKLEREQIEMKLHIGQTEPIEFAYMHNGGPGTTAVVAGEVIHFAKCELVDVVLNLTDRSHEELPVIYRGQVKYVQARTRIIQDIGSLPSIIKERNSWYSTYPALHSVDKPQIIQSNLKADWNYKSMDEIIKAGLYTNDEIETCYIKSLVDGKVVLLLLCSEKYPAEQEFEGRMTDVVPFLDYAREAEVSGNLPSNVVDRVLQKYGRSRADLCPITKRYGVLVPNNKVHRYFQQKGYRKLDSTVQPFAEAVGPIPSRQAVRIDPPPPPPASPPHPDPPGSPVDPNPRPLSPPHLSPPPASPVHQDPVPLPASPPACPPHPDPPGSPVDPNPLPLSPPHPDPPGSPVDPNPLPLSPPHLDSDMPQWREVNEPVMEEDQISLKFLDEVIPVRFDAAACDRNELISLIKALFERDRTATIRLNRARAEAEVRERREEDAAFLAWGAEEAEEEAGNQQPGPSTSQGSAEDVRFDWSAVLK